MTSNERTYVSLKFKNGKDFLDRIKLLSLPFPLVGVDDLHMTLMYSSDPFVKIDGHLVGKGIELNNPKFEILGEGKTKYLVISFENSLAQAEFLRLRMVYGFNHSFPTLKPHITIAIIEDPIEIKNIEKYLIMPTLPVLIVSEEKSEPIKE